MTYCFHSFPNIINIEYNFDYLNLKISWDIEYTNKLNKDNNQINNIIKIKKENENFIKIYGGNNKNCLIDKLVINTNYELECAYYIMV